MVEQHENTPVPDMPPEDGFVDGRQSGVRFRVPLVRRNREERRVAVHFHVSADGGVRQTGCTERIVHAPGCVEYLSPASLSPKERRLVTNIACGVAWEWSLKHSGPVAIVCALSARARVVGADVLETPEHHPLDAVICDFVPPIDCWLLEATCLAGTNRAVFETLLEDILTTERVPQDAARRGGVMMQSFDDDERVGRVLVLGPSAELCRRLANLVWDRLLLIIKQPY